MKEQPGDPYYSTNYNTPLTKSSMSLQYLHMHPELHTVSAAATADILASRRNGCLSLCSNFCVTVEKHDYFRKPSMGNIDSTATGLKNSINLVRDAQIRHVGISLMQYL